MDKNWLPTRGFDRRNDRSFLNFFTSVGRYRLGFEVGKLFKFLKGGAIEYIADVQEAIVTLAEGVIVGTAAGDLGHANGAEVVAAPGAGYVLEFCGATVVYDHVTAAYTGGGDDLVFQNGDGTTALSGAIASADLLGASGDKMVSIAPLATDVPLVANKPITLKSTAWTQPGTAAGVVRVHVKYRKIATGL